MSEQIISCLSSQRYNFLKANHNKVVLLITYKNVVYQVKDTIFWKQITTSPSLGIHFNRLFIKSKIQFFESKSQRVIDERGVMGSCLSSQRYNFLKANHNIPVPGNKYYPVVYQVKDTIFWKQITTLPSTSIPTVALFIKSKIQFFESKSQRLNKLSFCQRCCLSSQRYNFLKANHN